MEELELKKLAAANALEEKRKAIQEELKVPVYGFQITDKDFNPVDIFFKEPDRHTGSMIMSMYQVGNNHRANTILMETCLLKEASDPRISQEQIPLELVTEYNSLYYGALLKAAELVKYRMDYQAIEIKKK